MTALEKWNAIVTLREKHLSAPESQVESDWISILSELLDYKKILGDIDIRRTIHIGRGERVIPDIILCKEGRDLFCIELKQYNMPLTEEMKKQLTSYLDLLRLEIGVIVCQKLYICIRQPEKLHTFEIGFENDNSRGEKFIELFDKNIFSSEKVNEYINSQIGFAEHVNEILEETTPDLLIELLKDYFMDLYTKEETEAALNQLVVSVRPSKGEPVPNPPPKPGPNPPSHNLKPAAIAFFNRMGYNLYGKTTTFMSKTGPDYYWANPSVTRPNDNWYIILYDSSKKSVCLMYIPAGEISPNSLHPRKDKPQVFDLRIDINTYTDKSSGISFQKYIKETAECDLENFYS